jgi:hypothetical protein
MNFQGEPVRNSGREVAGEFDPQGEAAELSTWSVIAEQILHPTKANRELKRALDKVWEITEHD